jgi:RecB family exonuclease
LGATIDPSYKRAARSASFARRLDAALAGTEGAVPQSVRDAIAARLRELHLMAPLTPPEPPLTADARSLRIVDDELAGLSSQNGGVPERIVAAFRAQGATACEVIETIGHEHCLAEIAPIVTVSAALDKASELLAKTWEPADLRLALQRELQPRPRSQTGEAERPRLAEPQATRPIPGRRYQSASSLNLYAECARKWFFKYLCGAVEDKPTPASAYGTAFHAALEAFHRAYPSPGGIPARELELRLEGEINTAFEVQRAHFESEVEYRLNRRRAQRTAKKYLAWLHQRAAKEPFEVIGCEIKADVTIDGVEFRGYIDRVDRDERSGRVTVFDYKTGSIAESAAEYRKKINERAEFQLLYYYWAQTLAGATVRSLALVPLRDAHLDVAPIELEIVTTAPPLRGRDDATHGVIPLVELERARTAMVELGRKLSTPISEPFTATADPSSCRYCVYAPACREKPADYGQPFGR